MLAARSLDQLNKDPTGAFRMYECNQAAAGAAPRSSVDQAKAAFAQSVQGCIYANDFDTNVVNAGTVFRQKSSDRSLGAGCLEEFDSTRACGQHSHAHSLILNYLYIRQLQSKPIAPEPQSLVE
jgi:hypothetical protein